MFCLTAVGFADEPVQIGSRLELFADDYVIDRVEDGTYDIAIARSNLVDAVTSYRSGLRAKISCACA